MCSKKRNLISILENIPDNECVYVVFFSGMEIVLKNCENVDETIYDRTDLVIADVEKKVVGDKRFHTPGTKIEFSVNDIKLVKTGDMKTVLYESIQNTANIDKGT